MKITAISDPFVLKNEHKIIERLFDNGLHTYHILKPKVTSIDIEDLLQKVSKEFHARIVLHNHYQVFEELNMGGFHFSRNTRNNISPVEMEKIINKMKNERKLVTRSCHTIFSLEETSTKFDYVFLSPVFKSISKKGHKKGFAQSTMESWLQENPKNNVFALGGIDETTIEQAKTYGFKGATVLGHFWNSNPKDAPNKLTKLLEACQISTESFS